MNYAKAITGVVATVLSGLVAALTGDNYISNLEWINVCILGAGALSVFAAPNVPGARYTKAALAVITAMLTLAVDLIADGVTVSEWLQLIVAGIGALGVWAIPNSSTVTRAETV